MSPNASREPTTLVQEPTATSPVPDARPVYAGKILVEVWPDIWAISYPFDVGLVLFREQGSIFGVTRWSPDGEWIAYAKATQDCPHVGSIWISREDGSEVCQISPTVVGPVNEETGNCDLISDFPVAPAGFSSDGNYLAVRLEGLGVISFHTGQTTAVYPQEALASESRDKIDDLLRALQWRSFSGSGNRALLSASLVREPSLAPVLLWLTLGPVNDAHVLYPPPGFRFWYFPRSGPMEQVWSPDGKYLLLPDESEDGTESLLWRIEVEEGKWEVVGRHPVAVEYDRLKRARWSTDGRWAAWWSQSLDRRTDEVDLQVVFLDPRTWSPGRTVLVEDLEEGFVDSWVTAIDGRGRLVLAKGPPEGKVVLLDPEGPEGDRVLFTYEQLDGLFPEGWYRFGWFQP